MLNPVALVPGTTLPVRLYFEGSAAGLGVITAIGPGGAEVQATADHVGIAFLTLPTSGSWRLSFHHAGLTAELIFHVPPAS